MQACSRPAGPPCLLYLSLGLCHTHLGKPTLVDELTHGLQVGVAEGDVGLRALQQADGGLVHLRGWWCAHGCDAAAGLAVRLRALLLVLTSAPAPVGTPAGPPRSLARSLTRRKVPLLIWRRRRSCRIFTTCACVGKPGVRA